MKIAHRNGAAIVSLVFLILWFCQDLLLHGEVPFFRDLTNYFYPLRYSLYESYQFGELPLWDRYFAQGFPNLAAFQSGAFYPPHFVFFFAPFFLSLRLLFIAHFLIAAIGTYSLLRYWGYSRDLSILGALIFSLGGLLVSLTNLLNHFQSAVWLPWLILVWEHVLVAPRWSSLVTFTLTAALQLLAGSPEIFAMSMGVALLDGFRLRAVAREVSLKRILLALLAGTTLMAALIMAQLLPTAELILESRRSQSIPVAEATMWSLQPSSLWNLFFLDREVELSMPSGLRLFFGSKIPFLISSYMGLICLFGIALWAWCAERRERIFLTALVLASIAVALGDQALLYPLLYKHLPFIAVMRFPEKLFFLTYVFLFFMAISGLKGLLSDTMKPCKGPLLVLGAVCLVWLGLYFTLRFRTNVVTDLIALYSNIPPLSDSHTAATVSVLANLQRQAILALALFALILLRKRGKIRPQLFSVLLVSVVFVDLSWAHRDFLFTKHPGHFANFTPLTEDIAGSSRRFFYYPSPKNLHPASYSVIGRPNFDQAVALSFQNSLPNVGVLRGVEYFQEIDALNRRAYSDFLGFANSLDFERQIQLLRTFNVSYVLSFRELPEKGVRQIGRFPDYFSWLYQVEGTVPRAYIVNHIVIEKEPLKALQRLADPNFDPMTRAILYEDVEIAATGPLQAKVDIEHYGHSRVTLRAQTNGESVLILADSFYPGWKAFVNGKETKIFRTNHFYRAVILPEGKHTIEFRYEPLSFKIGVFISTFTLIGIVSVSIALAMRKRIATVEPARSPVPLPENTWT